MLDRNICGCCLITSNLLRLFRIIARCVCIRISVGVRLGRLLEVQAQVKVLRAAYTYDSLGQIVILIKDLGLAHILIQWLRVLVWIIILK